MYCVNLTSVVWEFMWRVLIALYGDQIQEKVDHSTSLFHPVMIRDTRIFLSILYDLKIEII